MRFSQLSIIATRLVLEQVVLEMRQYHWNQNEEKMQVFIRLRNIQIKPEYLITGYVVAVLLSGLYSIVNILYFQGSPNSIVSYSQFDRPDIPEESFLGTAPFGVHYFGDFLQPYDWARQDNPWSSQVSGANYPPFAIDIFALLALLPYQTSLITYLALMALVSIGSIWLLTPQVGFQNRLLVAIGFGLFSTPILSALDRGNLSGFLLPLFALFIWSNKNDKTLFAVLAFSLLVAIKVWPVALIVLFIFSKKIYHMLFGLLGVMLYSLFSLWIRSGDLWLGITSFINSNVGFAGNNTSNLTLAFERLMSYLLIPATTIDATLPTLELLLPYLRSGIALALIGISMFVVKEQFEFSSALALAGGVVFTGTLAPYAWFFVPVVVSSLLNDKINGLGTESRKNLSVLVLGLLAFCPIPLDFMNTGKGPSVVLLLLWVALLAFFSLRSARLQ